MMTKGIVMRAQNELFGVILLCFSGWPILEDAVVKSANARKCIWCKHEKNTNKIEMS